jgi:hypothetical protein
MPRLAHIDVNFRIEYCCRTGTRGAANGVSVQKMRRPTRPPQKSTIFHADDVRYLRMPAAGKDKDEKA